MNIHDAFEKYANFLESLSIKDISNLENFVAHNVLFVDPFHQVIGLQEMSAIFINLFGKLTNINFL